MFHAAIITSSDKCSMGTREDKSGKVIREILEKNGFEIVFYRVFPDERALLSTAMKTLCDKGGIDLIITTGGTGFSPRDVMPEATMAIIDRIVPGIPEAIRAYSMQITKRAMLSRAVAGIRRSTLIINLPGSPKAVEESLEYIIDQMPHALGILAGDSGECGNY